MSLLIGFFRPFTCVQRRQSRMWLDFCMTQEDCRFKTLDQLFGVPGSSEELAIEVCDD